MEKVAGAMSDLARLLAGVLTESLGHKNGLFLDEGSCFLRLNRYPRCPFSQEIHGLVPHTDSDFLTILDQDQVGGLHLMKDSKWVSVKPNPKALVVNIGDLFQVSCAALDYFFKFIGVIFYPKKNREKIMIFFMKRLGFGWAYSAHRPKPKLALGMCGKVKVK